MNYLNLAYFLIFKFSFFDLTKFLAIIKVLFLNLASFLFDLLLLLLLILLIILLFILLTIFLVNCLKLINFLILNK